MMATGPIGRLFARLTADDGESPVAPELDPPLPEGSPIAALVVRRRVDVRGTVTAVRSLMTDQGPWFEADLDDGTGRITLIWMGRSNVLAVALGRRGRVKGRLADHNGRRVIYNPAYTVFATDTDPAGETTNQD